MEIVFLHTHTRTLAWNFIIASGWLDDELKAIRND